MVQSPRSSESTPQSVLQVELLWKEALRHYLEDVHTTKREELRPPFTFTSLDLNRVISLSLSPPPSSTLVCSSVHGSNLVLLGYKNEKECVDAVGQQQASPCGTVRAGQGRVSRNYQHVFQKVVRHKTNNVGSVSLKIVMMGNSAGKIFYFHFHPWSYTMAMCRYHTKHFILSLHCCCIADPQSLSTVGKTSLLSRWHQNESSKTNVPR